MLHNDNHWSWTMLVIIVFLIVISLSGYLISTRSCMPTDMVQALQGECEFKEMPPY